ncbi:hypothetical protein GCM10011374_37700 [Kocuria dechangensis]|uniref:Uncharacterized protein n=1 Tax=Kocuria dechangensis TaxID=1176249 RepID=A0A917H7M6_9MICC|nr:hypothetical protein GCM10011374_37700 [Kocuria dechangensis]
MADADGAAEATGVTASADNGVAVVPPVPKSSAAAVAATNVWRVDRVGDDIFGSLSIGAGCPPVRSLRPGDSASDSVVVDDDVDPYGSLHCEGTSPAARTDAEIDEMTGRSRPRTAHPTTRNHGLRRCPPA